MSEKVKIIDLLDNAIKELEAHRGHFMLKENINMEIEKTEQERFIKAIIFKKEI